MKTLMRIFLLLAGVMAATICPAQKVGQVNDDTDIFLANPTTPPGLPNILIIWDNTANWGQTLVKGSTAYDVERAALSAVINGLPVGIAPNEPVGAPKFNVGLMLFTETGGGNSTVRGSYPRFHFRPMTGPGYIDPVTKVVDLVGNRARLAGLIDNLDTLKDRGSNAQYANAMHEAYLYFRGDPPRAGDGQVKRDTGSPITANPPTNFGDGGAFRSVKGQTLYKSPIGDGCQKNFIIFISNGTTDRNEDGEAQTRLTTLGGVEPTDPLPLNPSGEQASWADEYARFFQRNDISDLAEIQTAVVYTIAIVPPDSCNLANPTNSAACRQLALAASMAFQGGGTPFTASTYDQVVAALNQTFNEVQAVNSIFASVTLPVSVNPTTRGTNLNQIYMGLFRPDANLAPRWLGNLKLFKLDVNPLTKVLYLADSRAAPNNLAVDAGTGFLSKSAISHWTTDSTFWLHRYGAPGQSDSPDGDLVEKGGAAQRLRTTHAANQNARKLYTCVGCAGGTSLPGATATAFDVGNGLITAGALGAADGTERDAIINWARGADNSQHENTSIAPASPVSASTNVRPSIHGDVLHSRPAVVNYNRFGDDNDVWVFYGGNDGVLRAVKGGFASAAGQPSPGEEVWGFIDSNHFGQFKRLRDNTPAISITNKRPYFVDGSISTFVDDVDGNGTLSGGDKVYLYVSMRRGGRFIYALDVSDPLNPMFMWKKSSAEITELGYTFSEPRVARLKDRTNPVIIMGLGYDLNQDNDPVTLADAMGRGIIILDAVTGDPIWQAGPGPFSAPNVVTVGAMTHSIPSDIAIFDRDGDGKIDRGYVGDTGGNLWRIDIVNGKDPSTWTVNQLAQVGGAGVDARKFQYPPDVVLSPDSSGGVYDAILIGSGDREHPFNTTVVNNFYLFKDTNILPLASSLTVAPITTGELYNATDNFIQSSDPTVAAQAKIDLGNAKGWRLQLLTGEKVVSNAVTLGGATFFNTNRPVPVSSCNANLGEAREYVVNYENAGAVFNYDTNNPLITGDDRFKINKAGGYLPSPIPGIVSVGGGSPELFVLSGPSLTKPPTTPVGARYRTYWYLQTDM